MLWILRSNDMGFDQLLEMYLPIKYQVMQPRTICPICAYPLEETDRGLHCKFDGWTEAQPPMPFIPRIPDVTE